jgi:hypothetical protein
MRHWIAYLFCIIIVGCKTSGTNNLTLYYDFYCRDSLQKVNALVIESRKTDSDNVRIINISSSIDSIHTTFKEKVTDSGIYRSMDNLPFNLTHSFSNMKETKSQLPKSYPYFINKLTKEYKTKKYLFANKDSIEINFFDEAIPWYSYTNSYYSKQLGFFLIYYNPRTDCYFKLTGVEGLQNKIADMAEVENKILRDTSFFSKFLKDTLSNIPPPPLNSK